MAPGALLRGVVQEKTKKNNRRNRRLRSVCTMDEMKNKKYNINFKEFSYA